LAVKALPPEVPCLLQ